MRKIENINYSRKNIPEDVLDMYLPDLEEFPVLIYFHGGGIEAGSKEEAKPYAEYLTSNGIGIISCNYRMYPKAHYPEFIEDAAEAAAYVKNNISDYGKATGIFVGGTSAGAFLSMMLCFDAHYLNAVGVNSSDISGYLHNAGQPTAHFNVLRERGIDSRRIIVDESAPLYHIAADKNYPPMMIFVSDNDMENRYEQTILLGSTLKHFGYNENTYKIKVMQGTHCANTWKLTDENGIPMFAVDACQFIKEH